MLKKEGGLCMRRQNLDNAITIQNEIEQILLSDNRAITVMEKLHWQKMEKGN
jgi:hypothetical protein